MSFNKPGKPCEVIVFFPADLSPNDDGSIMFYIVLDSYSEFLFNLKPAQSDTDVNLLSAIKELMENKDFKRYSHSFTLVLHKYEYLRNEIENIINPYGGSLMVDDSYVSEKVLPVMEMLFKSLNQKR